jgi:hypothetical protein
MALGGKMTQFLDTSVGTAENNASVDHLRSWQSRSDGIECGEFDTAIRIVTSLSQRLGCVVFHIANQKNEQSLSLESDDLMPKGGW